VSKPIRVQVEKKSGTSGCLTVFAICLLIGLLIEFWYVALALAVIAGIGVSIYRSKQKEKSRHRPGPRDPWLNEVVVAAAEFGYTEFARNTGTVLCGVPLEGDLILRGHGSQITLDVFSTDELVHQAQTALLAREDHRRAVTDGKLVLSSKGHLLYQARGLGGRVVDESRLAEITQIVGNLPPPGPLVEPLPPRTTASPAPTGTIPKPAQLRSPVQYAAEPRADVLDQLNRLGVLHTSGVLTDREFEAKKEELLRRL
jgi:hypothetical protein